MSPQRWYQRAVLAGQLGEPRPGGVDDARIAPARVHCINRSAAGLTASALHDALNAVGATAVAIAGSGSRWRTVSRALPAGWPGSGDGCGMTSRLLMVVTSGLHALSVATLSSLKAKSRLT